MVMLIPISCFQHPTSALVLWPDSDSSTTSWDDYPARIRPLRPEKGTADATNKHVITTFSPTGTHPSVPFFKRKIVQVSTYNSGLFLRYLLYD
ncbi:hypothetical protein QBC43DRAFT_310827, partial [Cladorrhinum sp. PSN259]